MYIFFLKIDIDFKRLYQKNVTSMLSMFDTSFTKLLKILNGRVKDVKMLQDLNENVNASECKY